VYESQTLSENQGFYLNSSNSVILRNTTFVASAYPYSLNMTYTKNGLPEMQTFEYNYDNIVGKPTILDNLYDVMGATSNAFVSGVKVLYDVLKIQTTVTVTNMGRYFYRDPMLNFKIQYGGQEVDLYTNDVNTITDGFNSNAIPPIFSNSLTFQNRITSGLLSNLYIDNYISLIIKANNQNGSSDESAPVNIPVIVDYPSYNLVYTVLKQSIPSINGVGYRVWSGISPDAYGNQVPDISLESYTTIPYDNEWNISLYGSQSRDPSQELQVVNGKFRTKADDGYLDYSSTYENEGIDYSAIALNNYRYATFVWRIPARTNAYNTLTFSLNNFSPALSLESTPPVVIFNTTSPIHLFYRIENFNHSIPTNNLTNYVQSSQWIDGNSIGAGSDEANAWNYGTLGTSNTLRWGYNSYNRITNTWNVTLPFLIVKTDPIYIYCRIGLPMDIACSFESVGMNIS
jgi:hypothetical protein